MTVPVGVPGNYHARYDPAVGVATGRAGPIERKQAGVRRLAVAVPDLDVSYDDSTGLPVQLTTASGVRWGSDAATAVDAATTFVDEHADVWDLASPDVGTVEIRSVSTRGLRVVRLAQRVDGVEVFGSGVTLGLDARNGVVASRGQLFRGARTYMDGRSANRAIRRSPRWSPSRAPLPISPARPRIPPSSHETGSTTAATTGPCGRRTRLPHRDPR